MTPFEKHCLDWVKTFEDGGHRATAEALRKMAEMEAQARKAAGK